jgi:hypothetical protein
MELKRLVKLKIKNATAFVAANAATRYSGNQTIQTASMVGHISFLTLLVEMES